MKTESANVTISKLDHAIKTAMKNASGKGTKDLAVYLEKAKANRFTAVDTEVGRMDEAENPVDLFATIAGTIENEVARGMTNAERLEKYKDPTSSVNPPTVDLQSFSGSFEKSMEAFEADPDNGQKTLDFAFAIVRSVLRKLRNVSPDNMTVKKMEVDVSNYWKYLQSEVNADCMTGRWKKTGTFESVNAPIYFHLSYPGNDGADLVQVACAELTSLANVLPHKKGWMNKEVKIARLKKRVFTKSGNIQPEVETIDLKPVQIVFKAVRSYVIDQRSVKSQSFTYTYVKHTVKVGGKSEVVYTRHKNDGIQDPEAERVINDFMEKTGISDSKAVILKMLYAGYGINEIANEIGVTFQYISKVRREIGEMAVKVGYGNASMLDGMTRRLEDIKKKAVRGWKIDPDGKKSDPVVFSSITEAARSCATDPGAIRQVLNKKRKVAGGRYWEKV